MNDAKLDTQLQDLFREAGQAHHRAYASTDGVDPEWPLWYADYLHEKLKTMLNADFTRSQLVYLLVLMEAEQGVEAPGSDWAAYYSGSLLARYG